MNPPTEAPAREQVLAAVALARLSLACLQLAGVPVPGCADRLGAAVQQVCEAWAEDPRVPGAVQENREGSWWPPANCRSVRRSIST
jgi:hypothetical protein